MWFYFPAAFVIKMTIGFLILLAMVPFARALWQKELRREVVFLLLPPVIFFGSAMSAKVDIGIRHILPIMPFLIVLVARARRSRWRSNAETGLGGGDIHCFRRSILSARFPKLSALLE